MTREPKRRPGGSILSGSARCAPWSAESIPRHDGTGANRTLPPRADRRRAVRDEKALLSLIAAAQPDVRRYAARNCRVADIDDAVQRRSERRSEACLGGAILRSWPAAIGLDVSKGIFAEFL
ncbi:hypothetical protein [Bradyrhizobium sp. Ash2021]|uniref:hypothetical protein n=1 Tax=Bradyrhizobium sp. Ash2021 TaxID=2954771 RepID=UPI00281556C3|nr:hypothetical protein [Bradyrhizobium sp. Ash2021]WMT76682.1 hypothetical protein NL528_10085 [Bradyrhizobium sp. Ash2021]